MGGQLCSMRRQESFFDFSESFHLSIEEKKSEILVPAQVTAKLYDPIMSLDGCFLCDICSKTFSKSWELRLHKKIHLCLQDKHCLYCRKKFSDQTNLDEHKAKKHANGEYSEQFRVEALGVVAGVGIEKAAQKLMLHESTLRSWMTSRGENYCSECHKSFRFQSHLKNHMKLHEGKEGKPVRTFKEKKPNSICPELLLQHFRPNLICPEMLLQHFRTNWEFCETNRFFAGFT